jgi:inositol oxygenase
MCTCRFQLVGLLHDMGKIQFLWGTPEDGQRGTAEGPQFALGGDTWAVGCRIPDSVVFPEFNAFNKDMQDPRYNKPLGIYQPHCGIENVMWAWGHDEYMYRSVGMLGPTRTP